MEIVGGIEIRAAAKFREQAFNQAVKEFVEDAADYAAGALERHVPKGETLGLLNAVMKTNAERAAPPFDYEAFAGIGEVEGEFSTRADLFASPNARKYPLYVLHGTGVFADPPRPLIRATHGNVMAFHKRGEVVFTKWVKGQPPNNFLEKAAEETNLYIERKKAELVVAVRFIFSGTGATAAGITSPSS